MTTTTAGHGIEETLQEFMWEPQPKAQALINEVVADALRRCPQAADLSHRMKHESGTRFVDWLDHLQVPRTEGIKNRLTAAGFTHKPHPGAPDCYVNERGIFPHVILVDGPVTRIAIKVDWVADFCAAWHLPASRVVDGDPLSQLRRVVAFTGQDVELLAIERHGYRGYETPRPDTAKAVKAMRHFEGLRRREREFDNEVEGFEHLNRLLDAAIADLGRDFTCDLFFFTEREYWQRRNRAAQVQKARQDRLGLGWANHDHHTYRSSRQCFTRLVAVWEKLGFKCRERFYAGAEAGWGAQVMEHPVTGITTFNDVDMSPEELMHDFAHEPMEERSELGTVGLWCGLHGEAILQAGMHHLEAVFDHDALKDQLTSAAITTMDPFTNFPYLRQAFTEGERWPVADKRLAKLAAAGLITSQQSAWFKMQGGAIGSHLENLERNDGYKGFNQTGVSQIIKKTDPRKQVAIVGA